MSSTQINAHVDTYDHVLSHFFKVLGAVAIGLTGTKKRAGEVSLYFPFELNAVSFEVFPQMKI